MPKKDLFSERGSNLLERELCGIHYSDPCGSDPYVQRRAQQILGDIGDAEVLFNKQRAEVYRSMEYWNDVQRKLERQAPIMGWDTERLQNTKSIAKEMLSGQTEAKARELLFE